MKLKWNFFLAAGIFVSTGSSYLFGQESLQNNLADGSAIQIEELTINPIKGWQLDRTRGGMSVVIEEPKSTEVVYDKPTYSRNLSVSKYSHGAVINAEKLESFKGILNKKFATDSRFSEFSINEAKLVDVRAKLDGGLIFTSFKIGSVPMMQMHLLVSGKNYQYHLAYTDLASRMTSQDPFYNLAWQSFMSVKLANPSPEAPNNGLLAAVIGSLVLGVGIISVLALKKSKRDFNDTTETLFNDHDEKSDIALEVSTYGTAVEGWNLRK